MECESQPVRTKAQQQYDTPFNFKVIDFSQTSAQNANPGSRLQDQKSLLPKTQSIIAKSEKEFNIRQARLDVIRFAIKNQRQSKNKKKLEIQQLIKLGAKAPQKRYLNYKELLMHRKNLTKMREEKKEFHQLGKTPMGRASVNCRSKSGKIGRNKVQKAPVTGIDLKYGVVHPTVTARRKK